MSAYKKIKYSIYGKPIEYSPCAWCNTHIRPKEECFTVVHENEKYLVHPGACKEHLFRQLNENKSKGVRIKA